MSTAKEKRYLARLALMPCILCEQFGNPQVDRTEVHHIREGQGMSQRASHYLAIPLCSGCHRGKFGIHGDRSLLRIAKVEELDLLALTIERMFKG